MNFQSRLHVSLHDHFGLRYHFYVEKLKKKTNNDYLTNVAIFQKLLLLNFTQCYSMLLNFTQFHSIFTQFYRNFLHVDGKVDVVVLGLIIFDRAVAGFVDLI